MPIANGGGGGGSPTGAAGGDLGGTYPNPTVTGGTHLTAATVAIASLADPTTGKVIGSASNAAAAVFPPAHEFDYAEYTSTVTITASTEATAQTIVTGNSVTYDGSTTVIITFYAPIFQADSAGITRVILKDGSTSLGWLTNTDIAAVLQNNNAFPMMMARRLTPSAAAHTYSIAAFLNAAAQQSEFLAGAGGSGVIMPGFIRITKV